MPARDDLLYLFFEPTESNQAAGRSWWDRIHGRSKDTSGMSEGMADGGAGMVALIAALMKAGDVAHTADGCYNRLGDIKIPVMVAQERSVVMIPTVNSYQLSQTLPNAWLLIYPDSGQGFLFQFSEQFAQEANEFLDGW